MSRGKYCSNANSKRPRVDYLYFDDQYADILNKTQKFNNYSGIMKGKPKLFENILRITAIIIEIIIICSIPEFKAHKAIRTIIKGFLDYDTKEHNNNKISKRHIRKLEIMSSFENECFMNKIESILAYYIVKFAFYAFYYRQPLTHYEEHSFSEAHWREASRRTVEAFAKYKNLSLTEISNVSQEVNWIYAKYIERKKSECKEWELKKQKNAKHAEIKNKNSKVKVDSCCGQNFLQDLRKCQERIKMLTIEKLNWDNEMLESRKKLTEMENEAENWLISIANEKIRQENCEKNPQSSETRIENTFEFPNSSNINEKNKDIESGDFNYFHNGQDFDLYENKFSINLNVTQSGTKLELEVNGVSLKDKLSNVNKLNIKNNDDVVIQFNCNPVKGLSPPYIN